MKDEDIRIGMTVVVCKPSPAGGAFDRSQVGRSWVGYMDAFDGKAFEVSGEHAYIFGDGVRRWHLHGAVEPGTPHLTYFHPDWLEPYEFKVGDVVRVRKPDPRDERVTASLYDGLAIVSASWFDRDEFVGREFRVTGIDSRDRLVLDASSPYVWSPRWLTLVRAAPAPSISWVRPALENLRPWRPKFGDRVTVVDIGQKDGDATASGSYSWATIRRLVGKVGTVNIEEHHLGRVQARWEEAGESVYYTVGLAWLAPVADPAAALVALDAGKGSGTGATFLTIATGSGGASAGCAGPVAIAPGASTTGIGGALGMGRPAPRPTENEVIHEGGRTATTTVDGRGLLHIPSGMTVRTTAGVDIVNHGDRSVTVRIGGLIDPPVGLLARLRERGAEQRLRIRAAFDAGIDRGARFRRNVGAAASLCAFVVGCAFRGWGRVLAASWKSSAPIAALIWGASIGTFGYVCADLAVVPDTRHARREILIVRVPAPVAAVRSATVAPVTTTVPKRPCERVW